MNVTSFGSCRQHSLAHNFYLSKIQEELTYPHYTKEVIQAIEYCKNIHQYDNEYTKICFRSGVLNKKPIENHQEMIDQFNNTDIFFVEIASRLQYKWNGFYVHHILSEEEYKFYDREKVEISDLTDEEIESDLLRIRELLSPKPFIVVSHFYTKKIGKRYELVELLRKLTTKHNIPFIDPMDHLSQYDLRQVFLMEPVLSHYTDYGHKLISQVYKNEVEKVMREHQVNQ